MTGDSAAEPSGAGTPSSRRPMVGLLVPLGGAAVLGLVAAARPWAEVTDPASLTSTTTAVSGGDLVPLATPVFLVALAATLVIPVMRVVGRRVVGAVVAALGLTLVVACVSVATDLPASARAWGGGGDGLTVTSAVAWPVGTAVVAVVVAIAAGLVVVRAPSWPGLSSRYERRAQAGSADDATSTGNRETWDALDRGDDPTT